MEWTDRALHRRDIALVPARGLEPSVEEVMSVESMSARHSRAAASAPVGPGDWAGDAVGLRVVYEETAIDQAVGFLADDPDGVRRALDVIDQLGGNPRPAGSTPFRSPGLHRLRIGRYRVMYEITDHMISIGHIARATATG